MEPLETRCSACVAPEAEPWLDVVPGVLYRASAPSQGASFELIGPGLEEMLGLIPEDGCFDAEAWASRIHTEDVEEYLEWFSGLEDHVATLCYRVHNSEGLMRRVQDRARRRSGEVVGCWLQQISRPAPCLTVPKGLERLGFSPSAATLFARMVACANLGRREQEVAARLMVGLSNAEVARQLELSPLTVKTQVQKIFRKAGVTNRAALVWYTMNGEG